MDRTTSANNTVTLLFGGELRFGFGVRIRSQTLGATGLAWGRTDKPSWHRLGPGMWPSQPSSWPSSVGVPVSPVARSAGTIAPRYLAGVKSDSQLSVAVELPFWMSKAAILTRAERVVFPRCVRRTRHDLPSRWWNLEWLSVPPIALPLWLPNGPAIRPLI